MHLTAAAVTALTQDWDFGTNSDNYMTTLSDIQTAHWCGASFEKQKTIIFIYFLMILMSTRNTRNA
jgi:hypothetical protein